MRSTSSSSTAIVRSGATAATRCTKSRRAGAPAVLVVSGAIVRTCSPSTPRRSRLVVRTRSASPPPTARVDNLGGGVEDVLGVVEDEQDIERAGAVERVDGCDALSCEAERRCDRVGDARRLTDLRELDEAGAQRLALRSHPRRFDGETRLADAAGADQRDDARLIEQADELGTLVASSDERRRWGRRCGAGGFSPRGLGRYEGRGGRGEIAGDHHSLSLA